MKVIVFGPPGGGKSTLSARIAQAAGLPLHPLDRVQYAAGGERLPDAEFNQRLMTIAADACWVIDGYGTPQCFDHLLCAADVVAYVRRPAWVHWWWVTKRLLQSPLRPPPGWPERPPMLRSTWSGYRALRRADRFWTPAFRDRLAALPAPQRVFFIRSDRDARALLDAIGALQAAKAAAIPGA